MEPADEKFSGDLEFYESHKTVKYERADCSFFVSSPGLFLHQVGVVSSVP